MPPGVDKHSPGAKIVKEGWLQKRGEYIKNWRPRYFQLWSDGSFLGYKDPAKTDEEPLNNFTVQKCQIVRAEKPKPHSFFVRCYQWTTLVERLFHVETNSEREDWLRCIQEVSNNIHAKEEALPEQKHVSEGRKMSLDDFAILKVLGKGTFGKVMLAKQKTTGELFALKVLKKEVIVAKDEVVHTLTENRVLQQCKHPFLTELRYSFQTRDRLVFVMEYVNGGELFFHLSKERVFGEERSKFYATEIILAVQYLHEQGVVYRDLKLENLLLDADGHIKITDFGLCKEEITYGATTRTFCGTPEYLAPEVLEDSDYGRSVDWWGVGIVMYEMMCGRLPFYSRDHEVLFELILTEDVKFPQRLSDLAKAVLSGLLEKNPKKRLGGDISDANQIKRHPFFSDVVWDDVLNKKVKPPYVPSIKDDQDTSYFDREFTEQPAQLTPPGVGGALDGIPEEADVQFQKFSYINTENLPNETQ
ncbi:RAC-alpha serine/threonine-protein kinase-like [Dendronephthya gigantea]|uniref:RAC-alpha serine/threonine-protein kinase-like n=1 Tax=Dendronephthya gigantea TaxID=151771 RepID=UPI001069F9FB|nr:RAC-alpha serine/threonine-protein kinase-like [Dendronephthya gigantea]